MLEPKWNTEGNTASASHLFSEMNAAPFNYYSDNLI